MAFANWIEQFPKVEVWTGLQRLAYPLTQFLLSLLCKALSFATPFGRQCSPLRVKHCAKCCKRQRFDGQVGFFHATQDILVPEHSHAGQWGIVIEGTVELTVAGVMHVLKTGEHYNIPANVPHSAKVHEGSSFIDVWEGKRLEVDE